MIRLLEIAAELQLFCDGQEWKACFIGGLAVQRWGEPRVTRDVDLTLLTGFGSEEDFIDPLLAAYKGRISDARNFAKRARVLLLESADGVGIDISLGGLPFEEQVVNRATKFSFEIGIELRTCSGEDLMVMKVFAGRPLDIRDVEGVAVKQAHTLDWQYIEEQTRFLADLKEDPEMIPTLSRIRELAFKTDDSF